MIGPNVLQENIYKTIYILTNFYITVTSALSPSIIPLVFIHFIFINLILLHGLLNCFAQQKDYSTILSRYFALNISRA